MTKKVYISLPMKGRDWKDVIKQNDKAVDRLVELGLYPVTPCHNGIPHDAPISQQMAADYKLLLDCDYIYMCDGWEYSHGCMNEMQVAADCRKGVLYEHMTGVQIMWRTK